jgi:hypothetical protein
MNAIYKNADPKKGKTIRDELPDILKLLDTGYFKYQSSHKYV